VLRGLFLASPGDVTARRWSGPANEEVRVSDETPEQTTAESIPPAPVETIVPVPPLPPNGVEYDASAITVLEGLEAVRKRPGMYIGSTGERGLHHLIWEIVNNAVDESLAGYCDRVVVTLLEDGGVRVEDNGRGIPTDTAPGQDLPAVTTVLTVLHAGGKFGGGGYKVSGGLHGVGVSVVNALSSRLVVEVRNRGHEWRQTFSVGVPDGELEQVRELEPGERTGTTVTYWASTDVFETTTYNLETITSRMREYAFLNKGLEIVVRDERPVAAEVLEAVQDDTVAAAVDEAPADAIHQGESGGIEQTFRYDRGLVDFVEYLNKRKTPANPTVISFEAEQSAGTQGGTQDLSLEIAMQWNISFTESVHTFANTINTPEGGTHEEGFRAALTSLINHWGEEWGLIKKREDRVSGDDVREGLTAIISIKLTDAQFEGQTKSKLGNTEAKGFVQRVVNDHLGAWLE
jgi:DNA gyrase subunit B